jgi:hypothetical protein
MIKRRELPSYEELARAFVKSHRGRLLFVTWQWMEAIGSAWQPITNRKMNRLIRNAGWHAVNAASVRRHMEKEPLWGFVYSGPLPAIESESVPSAPAPPSSVEMAFLERHAGQLLYNQRSKCWMARAGSGWEYIFDREIDTRLCEISGDLSLMDLTKLRRELQNSLGFAVKEMVS